MTWADQTEADIAAIHAREMEQSHKLFQLRKASDNGQIVVFSNRGKHQTHLTVTTLHDCVELTMQETGDIAEPKMHAEFDAIAVRDLANVLYRWLKEVKA